MGHGFGARPKALEEAGNSTSTPLTACPACSYHTSKTQCHTASKPVLAVVKVSSSTVATAALSPSILYVDAVRHCLSRSENSTSGDLLDTCCQAAPGKGLGFQQL